jgi:hypothetical protein
MKHIKLDFNKTKLSQKILLSAIFGIMIFSFISTVAACDRRVIKRPIGDWLAPVELLPPVLNLPLGGMPDWDNGLLIWAFLENPATLHWASPLAYNPQGCVLERELKNNMMLVTVKMHVNGAPFYIRSLTTDFSNPLDNIFSGNMDFSYELQFTIDLTTLDPEDPEDYDEDGNIVFHTWKYYVFGGGGTFKSVFLCGHGTGQFLNSYGSWEEGDSGKMHVISYMVAVGPGYTGLNPYYNLNGLYEIPLVSNIHFH